MKDDKNIKASFPERTGYRVPYDYFDTLTDKITSRLDFKQVSENKVPAGYFNELPDRIIAKLDEKDSAKVVRHPFTQWVKLAGVAASLLLLVVIYNQFDTDKENNSDMVVSDELIMEYLSEYDDNIDATTLTEMEVIRDEFNLTDIIEDSDELYEYYLESNIDDLPTRDLEEIFK